MTGRRCGMTRMMFEQPMFGDVSDAYPIIDGGEMFTALEQWRAWKR